MEIPQYKLFLKTKKINIKIMIKTQVITMSTLSFKTITINNNSNINNLEQVNKHKLSYQNKITFQKMRRKDEQINIRLQKKRADEQRLKQQRKQKGKQELQKIKSNRISQIQQNKEKNRSEAANSQQRKTYNNQWAKISDNIGIKAGEYPGNKDITRMRDAILRKGKDQK